jgi:hypothetical protein
MTKILTSDSLAQFLTDLKDRIGQTMENALNTNQRKNAFTLVMNTMKAQTDEIFDYLPSGEREAILNTCVTWLDIGLLAGKAPQELVDILIKGKGKLKDAEQV